MNKLKSFLMGILLIVAASAMLLLVTLVYRANYNSKIQSYLFQLGNFASQRVDALQNINDISAIELRDKLITKYISEYFGVFPNDKDVYTRPVLYRMSTPDVYEQWQNTEANNIDDMTNKKMFRRVMVLDASIEPLNMPEDYDYYTAIRAMPIYYSVDYITETWPKSNSMDVKPVYEKARIYIEARFKPGIRSNIDIDQYLRDGESPAGLFRFEVTNVKDKEDQ